MTSRPRQLCAWGLGCMRAHMATHAGGAGRPYPVLDRGRVARARLVPAVKGERARCIHAQRACRALLHRALALRQLGLAARQRGRRGGRRRAARAPPGCLQRGLQPAARRGIPGVRPRPTGATLRRPGPRPALPPGRPAPPPPAPAGQLPCSLLPHPAGRKRLTAPTVHGSMLCIT